MLDLGLGEGFLGEEVGRVGPYRLIEKLGEGGLGVVWRAEQLEPIRREVAVKLIKPGMQGSAEVVARFEMERQALARMSHPNIACLLDAGMVGDQRPYFVMELVPGEPLTRFCDRRAMDRTGRLQLMSCVCRAVQHAHQKGVLHRDLKPSNILVHEQDGVVVPKIIDFGIAKALDSNDGALNDPFFQTQVGEMPSATYPYMSPEQAERGAQALDTRSDIYTLGVILYELLTGRLPVPEAVLKSGRFELVAAHVLEGDVAAPSAHVAGLRGELDWIVMRALARDPERRYESAAALADDLERYLRDEPVTAGPPSAWYRFRKWSRRHRVAFVTGSLVAGSLCAGLAAATTALVREKAALAREAAERARADESLLLALQREKDAEAARELAVKAQQAAEVDRSRAMESRQTADVARATVERLLNDVLFDLRDELEPMGRLALLEPISKSAETYFASVPASADNDEQQRNRAVMFESRGGLLLAQGDAAGALASFEQGVSLLRERLRQEEGNVQRMHDLALGLERVGSAREALGEMKLAEAMYEEMGGLFERMKAMGEGAWREDAALPAERLGDLRRMAGDATGAMRHYEAGLEWLEGLGEVTEVVRTRVAFLEEKMGGALEHLGQVKEAGARYERALGLLREVHLEAPENRRYEAALAIAHGRLAKVLPGREGLEHAREQVERFARLAELDPLHLSWQRQYAAALLQLGVSEEANGMGGEAVATFRRALGVILPTQEAHPEVVGLVRERVAVHLRLAAGLLKAGKDAEAKEQAGESLRLMKGLERTAELDGWRKTAEALMGL